MGCGASSASAAVPAAAADAAKGAQPDKGKKRDVQTTYRERLGEDFMKEFAKSQDAIRRLSTPAPERSSSPGAGSCASAASTTVVGEEFGARGTLISPYHPSPYATPPKDTLPEAENPAAADPACAATVDASGPYVSSAAKADARFGTGLRLVTTMSPGGGRGSLSRAGSSDSEVESEGRRRAQRLRPISRAGR